MNISHLSVKRPVTVLMLVLVVVILGAVSLSRLPIDLFPEIEAPVLAVVTRYEGAGPYEVENLISRPLESVLGSVSGVTGISSVSQKGLSIVVVEFEWGTDMNFAALDARESVDLIEAMLPDEADAPMVMKFNVNSMPIMQMVLVGNKQPHELRAIAEDRLKPRLERLDGVASVNVTGGQERQIQVVLHPGLMQTYGISIDTVVQCLQAANLNLPAGQVTEQGLEYVLRTTGEFDSVEAISDLLIPTMRGSMVRLAEIGTVHDGFAETTALSRYNGQPSISLFVQKETSKNIVQVAEKVRAAVDQLNAELDGTELIVVMDSSTYIQDSIDGVKTSAIQGAVLAVLVLLAFLRSIRPTLIIGVSIPVSIIATFTLIYFSNTTINMMTLGGLALGVGMLVDNSIVVLENIFRHWELGKGPLQAAAEGAEEVGTAISASTLTTVVVFLPVVFMSGITSEIFKDLALTVTFSLLASLVVAITVVPSLAARLFSSHKPKRAEDIGEKRSRFSGIAWAIGSLQKKYAGSIAWAISHRGLLLLIVGVLFAVSIALMPAVGTEFLPEMDEGTLSISVKMPLGTKLAETNRVVGLIENYAQSLPGVKAVYSSVGSGSSGMAVASDTGSETGTVGVQLVPMAERELGTAEIASELRKYVASIPGADIEVRAVSTFSGSFGSPIQVKLKGDDLDLLSKTAERLRDLIAQVEGATEVRTSIEETRPEFQIKVNREKAAGYGLTVAQIASTIRTAVNGQVATRFRTGGSEIDVLVKLSEEWRERTSDIVNIPIQTAGGTLVPLGEVVTIERGDSPLRVQREGQTRLVTVSGQVTGRDLGSVMRDVNLLITGFDLPDGISLEFGGQNQEMVEAFSELGMALLLGVVLVFMIMASQFESLMQPFAILFSLPMALIGVVLALLLGNTRLNVVGYVGIIMLAGIAVNNGIVLIDYINHLRQQGLPRNQAIVEAGKVRLRPILMTTLTTILGLLPMAIARGEGSEMQRPLALVVIGGLTTSTFLTLYVVPVVYSILDGISRRVRRWIGREQSVTSAPSDSVQG